MPAKCCSQKWRSPRRERRLPRKKRKRSLPQSTSEASCTRRLHIKKRDHGGERRRAAPAAQRRLAGEPKARPGSLLPLSEINKFISASRLSRRLFVWDYNSREMFMKQKLKRGAPRVSTMKISAQKMDCLDLQLHRGLAPCGGSCAKTF